MLGLIDLLAVAVPDVLAMRLHPLIVLTLVDGIAAILESTRLLARPGLSIFTDNARLVRADVLAVGGDAAALAV